MLKYSSSKISDELVAYLDNYKNILETFPDGIVLLRYEKILYLNDTVVSWINGDKSNKIGENFSNWVHHEDVEFIRENIYKDLNGIKPLFTKIRIKSKNKGWVNVNMHLQKIKIFDDEFDQAILYNESVREEITRERYRASKAEKKSKELALQNAHISSIFNSMNETLIWTMDKNLNIKMVNSGFISRCEHFFDFSPKSGDNFVDLFRPFVRNGNFHNLIDPFTEAFKGNPINFDDVLNDKHMNEFWASIYVDPVIIDNEVVEICCIGQVITDRKNLENELRKNLEEKEVLLKEVHHRVKNNLQLISSMLSLQSSYVNDDKIKNILSESQNRVKSMSYIHENLYQTKNFSAIQFSTYIRNISNNLFHMYSIGNKNSIKLNLDLDNVLVQLNEAIPCGLIVNELLTNSFKYAFPDNRKGCISISLKLNGSIVELMIKDDGVGMDPDFDYTKSKSLGLQLVYTLKEQLNADITVNTEHGTNYLIKFVV